MSIFAEMNRHKYLDMLKIVETHRDSLRIVIAEAGAVERAPDSVLRGIADDGLKDLLKDSKPIEVTSESAHYEIIFEDYIAYAITNESYAGADKQKEAYEGRLARVYSKSAFLEYIANGTFATSENPGPFIHYGFCCLNQIVDIVSEDPPTIKLVEGYNNAPV